MMIEKAISSPRLKTINQVTEQLKSWKIPDLQAGQIHQFFNLLNIPLSPSVGQTEAQQKQLEEANFKKLIKNIIDQIYDPFAEKQETQARIMLVKTLQDQILEFERAETTIKIQKERLQALLKNTESSLLRTNKDLAKEVVNNLFQATTHSELLKHVQHLKKVTEPDHNHLRVIQESINPEKMILQVQEELEYFKNKLKQFWEIPFDYEGYLVDLYHQRQKIPEIEACNDITKQIWVNIKKQIGGYCGKETV